MQVQLFDIPEHARVVTSFGFDILDFIVKPCIIPDRVILRSIKYPGYSILGIVREGDNILINSLFPIVLTKEI